MEVTVMKLSRIFDEKETKKNSLEELKGGDFIYAFNIVTELRCLILKLKYFAHLLCQLNLNV